jgi:hypothetical protein
MPCPESGTIPSLAGKSGQLRGITRRRGHYVRTNSIARSQTRENIAMATGSAPEVGSAVTIEHSHGKARPTLPRSSDLAATPAADPTEGRLSGGRFGDGNRFGEGQRWKSSIKRLLGRGATDSNTELLYRESLRLYMAVLRDMPHDGPAVRALAALQARHAAMAAHWTTRAVELGPETDEGLAAEDRASKHGQRVERLTVTMLDVARSLAQARARDAAPIPLGAALVVTRSSPVVAPAALEASQGQAEDKPAPTAVEAPVVGGHVVGGHVGQEHDGS